MKKALLTSVLALSLTIPAIGFAQTASTPPTGSPGIQQKKGPRGDMMRDMNLTQKQKEQIRAIMQKQRLETQRQIRAVLTPEQQKKFDEQKAQRDARKQQYKQKRQQQRQQSAPQQ